jgi:hypothetical protein
MEMLLIYILKYRKEHLSSYGKGQAVRENSVKAFHGGDECVAILYEISTLGSSYTRYSSIPNSSIVLTIVHSDGTSILSLHTTRNYYILTTGILSAVLDMIYSQVLSPLRPLLVRSLLLTIFASFVTCDVFTAQIESGDLKVNVT